jgi:hypothetical protein
MRSRCTPRTHRLRGTVGTIREDFAQRLRRDAPGALESGEATGRSGAGRVARLVRRTGGMLGNPLHSEGRAVAAAAAGTPEAGLRFAVRGLAVHDWMLLAYFGTKLGLVLLAGRGGEHATALLFAIGDVAWLGLVLWFSRSTPRPGFVASIAYRASLVALPIASFLQLRWILPVVTPFAYDEVLYTLDLRLFGVEPAVAWAKYATPFATEWFAFFYYSYFVVLALHAIPIALVARDGFVLRRFSLGILFTYCFGQLLWFVVPGYGPYAYLEFEGDLPGGFWWRLVYDTVMSADAQKDIFPSLHTATPVFIAFFAFRHRMVPWLRWTWPITTFFAAQIVLSTMFLRWHYLADVVAGVGLAIASEYVAWKVEAWESGRRRRRGLPPVFPTRLSLHPSRDRATPPSHATQGSRG